MRQAPRWGERRQLLLPRPPSSMGRRSDRCRIPIGGVPWPCGTLWDHPRHLGNIGKTLVRIHPKRPFDCAGGAGTNAAVTRSAGAAYGRVRFELNVGDDLRQEDVRSETRRETQAFLPNHPIPETQGDGPVDRRSRIDIRYKTDRMIDGPGEKVPDQLELLAEDGVVVVAPSVTGDEATRSPLDRRVVFVVGKVGDGDRRLCSWRLRASD